MTSSETVLITGCSDGGIGSALALLFQQRGFHVFATARDPSKMTSLNRLPNVTLLTLDVVKSDHIKSVVDAVSEHTGGTLNYFISNAGRNHFMPILDEDLDAVRNLFEINFLAPIALTQAFAPLLIKAKGTAVYITSISGYVNVPYMGTYAASKRSLELVAETLRLELSPFGVSVVEIVTGAVKTNGQTYFGDFQLPAQSLYKPIEGTIASRAQGHDHVPRMDTVEYATAVVDAITNTNANANSKEPERTSTSTSTSTTGGRFWFGNNAESVRVGTTATAVPQDAMDAGAAFGTGLDKLGK